MKAYKCDKFEASQSHMKIEATWEAELIAIEAKLKP